MTAEPMPDLSQVGAAWLKRELAARELFVDRNLAAPIAILGDLLDVRPLTEAAVRLRCGEVAEALHWIERAAPHAFAGLAERCAPREDRR